MHKIWQLFLLADNYLFDRVFQPIVDYSFNRWGYNNYRLTILAEYACVGVLVQYCTLIGWDLFRMFLIALIIPALCFVWIPHLKNLEERANRDASKGVVYVNPNRTAQLIIRLLFLCYFIVTFITMLFEQMALIEKVFDFLLFTAVVSTYYFYACNTKPRNPLRQTAKAQPWMVPEIS